jgi:hypothetical protein
VRTGVPSAQKEVSAMRRRLDPVNVFPDRGLSNF